MQTGWFAGNMRGGLSETWQLAINTGTSMVKRYRFLIRGEAGNRDCSRFPWSQLDQ